MHDFDTKQRERQQQSDPADGRYTFALRGETFRILPVQPYAALRKLVSIRADSPDQDAFTVTEEILIDFIIGDDAKQRFRKVVNNTDTEFPVTFLDMLEIRDWMLRESSDRPPTQPGSSSGSQSKNGTVETASSSSEPAGASTS